MGYSSIRMHMFKGDRHIVTRALETGMRNIDGILAEVYSVDPHTAHNYLLSNFENCQNKEQCLSAFGNMAVELMRAMNFYRFSNPDSKLEDVWICGGGACIGPLKRAITETLDMNIHPAAELIPGGASVDMDYSVLQAVGIALS
jgi:type IV pilus assembly protein PilM